MSVLLTCICLSGVSLAEVSTTQHASLFSPQVGQLPLKRYLPAQKDGMHHHFSKNLFSSGGTKIAATGSFTSFAKTPICCGCRRYK